MVKDLGVVNRLDIVTAVCNGCICGTKLNVLNTVGQTSKCGRKVGICVNISIGIGICFCTMCQCGESKVVKVFQAKLRSDILETLDSNGIDGITDGSTEGSGTIEVTACIINWGTILIGDRLILVGGSQCHALFIEGRSIGGYDLKCGTRLTGTVCGTVQGKTGSLGSPSANDRLHIPGMLVDNSHC